MGQEKHAHIGEGMNGKKMNKHVSARGTYGT
jgi:hypothetical protein